MSCRPTSGVWRSGPNAGLHAHIVDVRAGNLYTVDDHSNTLCGDATDFVTSEGITGAGLLNVLVPPPMLSVLLHGAIREAVAHSHSVLFYGHSETRAFDTVSRYIACPDDGNLGVIHFGDGMCVGTAREHVSDRQIDLEALRVLVPAPQYEVLESLSRLPLVTSSGDITCAFWSSGDRIVSSEPWHTAYRYGAEVFHREILEDDQWIVEACEHYAMDESLAAFIVSIVQDESVPVQISRQCSSVLFPEDHPNRAEAIVSLTDGGAFIVE